MKLTTIEAIQQAVADVERLQSELFHGNNETSAIVARRIANNLRQVINADEAEARDVLGSREQPPAPPRKGPAKRVFLTNLDSGEPGMYCGTLADAPDLIRGLGFVLQAEVDAADGMGLAKISLEVKIREMTDEEVAALPEM